MNERLPPGGGPTRLGTGSATIEGPVAASPTLPAVASAAALDERSPALLLELAMPACRISLLFVATLLCLGTAGPVTAEDLLPIVEPKRDKPVDFDRELLPVLKRNCLACHNAAKAENSLVLETPQTMLKGGDEGPAIVPGKSAESLLLKVAAHQVDPAMPPDDNNVGKSLLPLSWTY